MSVVTITSSERGRDYDLDLSRFPLCCGLRPSAYQWPKKRLISVMCSNPECENHKGVLAADCDIEKKWKKYAKKETPTVAAQVFHPGEFVKEEMESRGWSIETLATASDLKVKTLEEVIAGHRKVTPIVALGLSRAFETGRQIWLNLQASWEQGSRARNG